ncbi:hypothetical protein Q670_13785 [Alcanivorax sp. P2S70]|uniref:Curli assembly protein CsgC n=1 Tax=Alcanivorax profundi TaxID=2338368 RepID=A0A418XX14_9GAMM|nr:MULTISPECIES: hypothetical protein [Alcanivorax]ERP90476.1 hypothetical protein Q670_13785 [Alcanivorax sp. P2S70]RJG17342.1 hypothetical protein D4A39_11495 [Alcanivorax profundi]
MTVGYRFKRPGLPTLLFRSGLVLLGGIFFSPAYSNRAGSPMCTMEILHENRTSLHHFQLSVTCETIGEPVYYDIVLEKQGQSGKSRSRQSGKMLSQIQPQRAGQLSINIASNDKIRITAVLRNEDARVIAERSQIVTAQ